MSSSERPEFRSFSKALAWRFRAANLNALSRITAQDHREATSNPIITVFTTQSAMRKSAIGSSMEAA